MDKKDDVLGYLECEDCSECPGCSDLVDSDIDNLLSGIDVSDFCLDFGPLQEGEKVVSEFTEIERKIILWHLDYMSELEYFSSRVYCLSGNSIHDEQWNQMRNDFEELKECSEKMMEVFYDSMSKRLAQFGKVLVWRGNFLIATSEGLLQDIVENINEQELLFRSWVYSNLGKANRSSLVAFD